MDKTKITLFLILMIMTAGCVTTGLPKSYERHKDSIQYAGYEYEILSDPLGVRVEIDNICLGVTPIKKKLTGAIRSEATILLKAFPLDERQCLRVKELSGRNLFPKKIFFNMFQCSSE